MEAVHLRLWLPQVQVLNGNHPAHAGGIPPAPRGRGCGPGKLNWVGIRAWQISLGASDLSTGRSGILGLNRSDR